MNRVIKIFFYPFLLLFIFSCGDKQSEEAMAESEGAYTESSAGNRSLQDEIIEAGSNISYSLLPATTSATRDSFRNLYDNDQWQLILDLNRIDEKNLWRLDSLVIPDEFPDDMNLFSPFPSRIPMIEEIEKLMVFSYPVQAFAAYEYGYLVRWGPVSMGRKQHITPTGLLYANWKAERSVSTINRNWILPWNVNIHNTRGVSIHQYELPGYPASHACLRLKEDDARWNYEWVDTWILGNREINILAHGSPVVIFGEYNWEGEPPWRQLPEHPGATRITIDKLEEILGEFMDDILEKQEIRKAVEGSRLAS